MGTVLNPTHSLASEFDSAKSIIENLEIYRDTTPRNERGCIILGPSELKLLLKTKVSTTECKVVSESEPDYSEVLEILNNYNIDDINPVSPIPRKDQISDFITPFIRRNRIITIMASPKTHYLALEQAKYIEKTNGVKTQILVPEWVYELPKVYKRITGDVVLVLHDPEILRNPSQVQSFMQLMIKREIPVVGVSPYFKDLGGLIELSKPRRSVFEEVIGNPITQGTYMLDYWGSVPTLFSLNKELTAHNIKP